MPYKSERNSNRNERDDKNGMERRLEARVARARASSSLFSPSLYCYSHLVHSYYCLAHSYYCLTHSYYCLARSPDSLVVISLALISFSLSLIQLSFVHIARNATKKLWTQHGTQPRNCGHCLKIWTLARQFMSTFSEGVLSLRITGITQKRAVTPLILLSATHYRLQTTTAL